jgi:hypothetical protein
MNTEIKISTMLSHHPVVGKEETVFFHNPKNANLEI